MWLRLIVGNVSVIASMSVTSSLFLRALTGRGIAQISKYIADVLTDLDTDRLIFYIDYIVYFLLCTVLTFCSQCHILTAV